MAVGAGMPAKPGLACPPSGRDGNSYLYPASVRNPDGVVAWEAVEVVEPDLRTTVWFGCGSDPGNSYLYPFLMAGELDFQTSLSAYETLD